MRATLTLFAFFIASACDVSALAQESAEVGRFLLVPAPEAPSMGEDGFFRGWLLDTKTGALEFCTYHVGGRPLQDGGTSPLRTLTCVKRTAP
jgi:hypothetical protein